MQIAVIVLAVVLGLTVVGMVFLSLTAKPTPKSESALDDIVIAELPERLAQEMSPRVLLKISSYWIAPVLIRPRTSRRPIVEILLALIEAELPILTFPNPQDPEPRMSFLVNPEAMSKWLHHLRRLRKSKRAAFIDALADTADDATRVGMALDGQAIDGGSWREEVAGLVPQLILELERCQQNDHVLMINYRGAVDRSGDLGLARPPLNMRVLRTAPLTEEACREQIAANGEVTAKNWRVVPLAPLAPPPLLVLLQATGDDIGLTQVGESTDDKSAMGLTFLLEAEALAEGVLPTLAAYLEERSAEVSAALAADSETAEADLLAALVGEELGEEVVSSPELSAALAARVLHAAVEEAIEAGDAIVVDHVPVPLQQLAKAALEGQPFETVKESLRVRLQSAALKQMEDQTIDGKEVVLSIVYREDLEHTLTTLEFDLPTSIASVSRPEAEGWGKTDEELFAVAFENVRTYHPLGEGREEDLDGPPVTIFEGDEYVTAYALSLHERPELVGPGGIAFGVPHRNALVAAPLPELTEGDPQPYLQMVQQVVAVTAVLNEHAEYAVSPVTYLRNPDGHISLAMPGNPEGAEGAEASAEEA